MTIQAIAPNGWKTAKGYAYAIRGADRLSVAGIVSTDPTTGELLAPRDFAGQWSQIWRNLGEVLDAAGTSFQEVTTLRIYLTDLNAYREAVRDLGKPWRAAFGDHLPAITMVQVSGLVEPDAQIEVEAEALVKEVG
jgi:enamine deaminase RidA (YjgF/YER057c/UK114 family)